MPVKNKPHFEAQGNNLMLRYYTDLADPKRPAWGHAWFWGIRSGGKQKRVKITDRALMPEEVARVIAAGATEIHRVKGYDAAAVWIHDRIMAIFDARIDKALQEMQGKGPEGP